MDKNFKPALIGLSNSYNKIGNHEKAVQILESIKEEDPKFTEAYLSLGSTYIQMEK